MSHSCVSHAFKSALGALLFVPLLITACSTEDPDDPQPTTPTPTSTSPTLSFWTRSDLGVGNINVFVEGQPVGTISHYYANGVTCGSSDVSVTKTPGTYDWTATGTSGGTWKGSITVAKGECKPIELTQAPAVTVPIPSNFSSQGTITVANTNLQICARDFGQIDRDIIDLLIDGKYYIQNYTLTGTNQCFNVSLPRGSHWIGVIAKSEGTISPCTPGISINDGNRTQTFEIQSYVGGSNGAYTIKVQL